MAFVRRCRSLNLLSDTNVPITFASNSGVVTVTFALNNTWITNVAQYWATNASVRGRTLLARRNSTAAKAA